MPPSPEGPQGGAGADGPTQEEVDRRFAELVSDPELQGMADPEGTTVGGPAVGGPRDYAVPDEPEDSFEPPEPESLASADPIRLLAWTGAIAGPVLLLILVLLWPTAPAIVWLSLVAAILLGWGVAFWRLPRSRDDDDDGAVV